MECTLSQPENPDFRWQGSTDDVFNSFVNPESFHFDMDSVERDDSSDFTFSFDSQASSTGDDLFEMSPVSLTIEVDPLIRQSSASSFDQVYASESPSIWNHLSVYSTSDSRVEVADTKSVDYASPTPEPLDECAVAAIPSTPRWRSQERHLISTPLPPRNRHCSISPHRSGRIDRSLRKLVTAEKMRRSSPQRSLSRNTSSHRRLHEMIAAGEVDLNRRPPRYSLSTPPPSSRSRRDDFIYDQFEDSAIHSPSTYRDDLLPPLSPPLQFQRENGPVESPTPASRRLTTLGWDPAEPHSQMSSYPSSPLDSHPESFSLTPLGTEPMEYDSPWTPQQAFMHFASQGSPDTARSDKAEHWSFTGGGPVDHRRGAPAAAHYAGLGLDIHYPEQNFPRGQVMQTGGLTFDSLDGVALTQHSPTPRMIQSRPRPLSADFAASALSSAYNPLSPLLESPGPCTPSPATATQSIYSPSPSLAHHHHHHHHHRRTSSSSALIPQHPPSPTKHHRRKSSSSSNHGFVNFTPSDHAKLLTGVAPSGSSKTKARRDKEAADKRRRLSEAAKRAVLEVGGDLGVLERVEREIS